MPNKTIQTISNEIIARLKSDIELQLSLLKNIKSVLPEGLAEHALHCVLKNRELVIFTDSGAWASQIRFYNGTILSALKANNLVISKMQVKVLKTHDSVPGSRDKLVRIPSREVIAAIYEQSRNLEQNEIGRALSKLSATLNRLQNQ